MRDGALQSRGDLASCASVGLVVLQWLMDEGGGGSVVVTPTGTHLLWQRQRQVIAERTLKEKTAQLRRLLDEQERQAARIDARGLPVVGFGILLSGVPNELASIPLGLGWALPLIGLVAATVAVLHAWRERHRRDRR